MSYRLPTRRMRSNQEQGINLVPILDAVFILIFFLLMSAQFVHIFEISSDVPIVSNEPPPKSKKKPLGLSLRILKNSLVLTTGHGARTYKTIKKTAEGEYDYYTLHEVLLSLKAKYIDEQSIVFEPVVDLTYEEIVKLMDEVRVFKKTDDIMMTKDKKTGEEVPLKTLFPKIMFGNIMS